MATYRTIAPTEDAVEAFITAELADAWTNNHIAAMEGDATAVAAGVTLKDPALDTGAATTAGTNWVALRNAGVGAGVVGAYALLSDQTNMGGITNRNTGSTLAGASLLFSNGTGTALGSAPSGTWRCMGFSQYAATGTMALTDQRRITLWLRIS